MGAVAAEVDRAMAGKAFATAAIVTNINNSMKV